ncbi:MAG: uroporphyrinogen-III synthase [Planctomycetota bacterium]|nr:uroporphyrinogen-III synthase [Planctomycetota bacterium]
MNEPPDPPLTGRCVVVTRPRNQSSQLREQLEQLGARVISFPTIKIVPARDASLLEAALQRIRQYDWILLTSRNAVEAVGRTTRADVADALGEVPIAVVGMATLRCLASLGIHAEFVPSQFNMATLCSELIQETTVDGQRFLYPCSDLADTAGPQALRDAGAIVDAIEAYRTIPDDSADADALRRSLAADEIDAIVFASPSAVRAFFNMIAPQSVSQRIGLISIGPKTTQALKKAAPDRVTEARQAEVEGLVETLIRAFG